MSVGDLVIGWLLIRGAIVAQASPADDFYRGKIAVAKFFADTVLPELSVRRQILERTDNALMEDVL
ncbi:MAG TPA: acyl-CoA dehydrogenase, partial [Micromonosporaceae bacterium]|nr:acyl-CoA dehydrogenase [Micromonosporaceae bacterium]